MHRQLQLDPNEDFLNYKIGRDKNIGFTVITIDILYIDCLSFVMCLLLAPQVWLFFAVATNNSNENRRYVLITRVSIGKS